MHIYIPVGGLTSLVRQSMEWFAFYRDGQYQ